MNIKYIVFLFWSIHSLHPMLEENIMTAAVLGEDTALIKKILENIDIKGGKTQFLLNRALDAQKTEIVEFLLKKGVSISPDRLVLEIHKARNNPKRAPILKLITQCTPTSSKAELIKKAIKLYIPSAVKIITEAGTPIEPTHWEFAQHEYEITQTIQYLEAPYFNTERKRSIKNIGRIIRDYLGVYMPRGGISKYGMQTICNDGTGHAIVLPEIVLKNIARYCIL